MKKIMPILVLCLFTIALAAQEGESRFGFEVSPSINWMRSDDNLINSNGPRLGVRIGGIGEFPLTDWIVIQGGFGFSFARGGTLLHKVGGNLVPTSDLSDPSFNQGQKPLPDDTDITYSLSQLEVPFGLQFIFPLSQSDYDLFFSFPTLNLAIISRTRGKINATGIDLKGEDLGADVRTFNLSWGIGGGIRTLTSNDNLFTAGLYYESGLADLTSNDGSQVMQNPDGSFAIDREDSRGTLSGLILKFAILF